MRITSKGQVTIPKEIREEAGLLPHTEVEFVLDGQRVELVRRPPTGKTRGELLIENMRGRATIKWTTDELMGLLRGED